MKAIKIASGFAVTALAAAVSMQANAAAHGMSAETSVETTGEINVRSLIDLENSARVNYIKDETDGDQDAFELTIETTVTHGPFSGKVIIEEVEDAVGNGPLTDATTVRLDDLIVTDGAISFGQLGDVMMTDSLLETVADDDDASDLSYNVKAGFRYTSGGLKVQAEGDGATHVFGVGVGFTQDIGMGNVYVEGQYSEDGLTNQNDAFMGVGADLALTEELTVVAAFQSNSGTAEETAMGVRGTFATDALTAYAAYYDPSTTADDEQIIVGGSVSMGMLTPYAEYVLTTDSTGGDELEAGVKYANGAIGGKAEVTMSDLDGAAPDPVIELDVTYSSESGVKYAAEYTMQSGITNEIELIAAYSF